MPARYSYRWRRNRRSPCRPGWLVSGNTWLRSASDHHRSISSRSRSGSCVREVDGLGEVLGDVVQLPLVLVERLARVAALVAEARPSDGTSPPSIRRGRWRGNRASRSTACRAARARRQSANVSLKLAPSIARCCTPAIASGASMPITSSSVGITSIAWTYCWRTSPGRPMPSGHHTISGSVTPPSCVSRFHRFSGVLPAHAHPQG